MNTPLNVVIFNSYPYHYEMFGYIIYYCFKNNHKLKIYTTFINEFDWLQFYKVLFNRYNFEYKELKYREDRDDFNACRHEYDLIFLPTDNDPNYLDNRLNNNDNVIKINHSLVNRKPEVEKYINIRPFYLDDNKWAIPCFDLLNKNDKLKFISKNIGINILILGSIPDDQYYNTKILNRLKHDNKITINAVSRNINKKQFYPDDNPLLDIFELNVYQNISTFGIINLLYHANYVIVDIRDMNNLAFEENKIKYTELNSDVYSHMLFSAIPLSYSSCTPLIISKNSNKYYKFENVIEFNPDNNDPIILTNLNYDLIINERKKLVDMFENNIANMLK